MAATPPPPPSEVRSFRSWRPDRPGKWGRHQWIGLGVAVPMAVIVGIGFRGVSAGGIARLYLLLGLVLGVVALVSSGFDRRYPGDAIGAVVLRLVALAAGLSLVLVPFADPFVFAEVRLTDPGHVATIVLFAVAPVVGAIGYRRRSLGRPPAKDPDQPDQPAPGVPPPSLAPRPVGEPRAAAIAIVAVPLSLGALMLAFIAAWCGSSGAIVLLLLVPALPVLLAATEKALLRRWPTRGLAVSIGRLSLVGLIVFVGAVVLAVGVGGDQSCESTIGGAESANPAAVELT